MNRREFVKLSVLASAAIVLNFGPPDIFDSMPAQVRHGDSLFKWNTDGEILVSQDSGSSWQAHTRFAPGVSVIDMAVDRSERIYARVGYSGYSFQLKLAGDGVNWMTV